MCDCGVLRTKVRDSLNHAADLVVLIRHCLSYVTNLVLVLVLVVVVVVE